jgi:ubiquinone/menaquinone biosynthesis C-methylase UbiE
MCDDTISSPYFETRLAYDRKREVLWTTLASHVFQALIRPEDSVLELGAGWCDFINSVSARRRIAVDLWPGVAEAAATGVETHVRSADDLAFLADGTINLVFASNLLEHLDRSQTDRLLAESLRVLAPGGRLVLVQPNFRLCSRRYFDDYTHISIWSDVGLSNYLEANGWELERVAGRFLPLTVKSRLPVSSALIRTYLASPVKPLAGQMLVMARKPRIAGDPQVCAARLL